MLVRHLAPCCWHPLALLIVFYYSIIFSTDNLKCLFSMVSENKVEVEEILVCSVSTIREKVQSVHMFHTSTMWTKRKIISCHNLVTEQFGKIYYGSCIPYFWFPVIIYLNYDLLIWKVSCKANSRVVKELWIQQIWTDKVCLKGQHRN